MSSAPYTIGFANITERYEFAQVIRAGLEKAALDYPDVRLIVRDNNMDDERALANAQEFADLPVQLAIIFHINERINTRLSHLLLEKEIPIISVDIPIPLTTYFGADNQQAGILAGEELGRWVLANWNGRIDKVVVLTDRRVLDFVRQRFTFALERLGAMAPFNPKNVLYLDLTDDHQNMSEDRAVRLYDSWADEHNIVIMGINDESVLKMVEVARHLGREQDVVAIGHNASLVERGFSYPDSRFIGSIAYFPERYGRRLMTLARSILAGERVPRQNFIEHKCITRANFDPAHGSA